jgi:hypothetical protein
MIIIMVIIMVIVMVMMIPGGGRYDAGRPWPKLGLPCGRPPPVPGFGPLTFALNGADNSNNNNNNL